MFTMFRITVSINLQLQMRMEDKIALASWWTRLTCSAVACFRSVPWLLPDPGMTAYRIVESPLIGCAAVDMLRYENKLCNCCTGFWAGRWVDASRGEAPSIADAHLRVRRVPSMYQLHDLILRALEESDSEGWQGCSSCHIQFAVPCRWRLRT